MTEHAATLPIPADAGSSFSLDRLRRDGMYVILAAMPLLGLALMLTDAFPDPLHGGVVGIILMVLPIAVWKLLSVSCLAGACMLVAGSTTISLLTFRWSGADASACLLALPTMIATSFIGTWGGITTGALCSAVLIVGSRSYLHPVETGTVLAALSVVWSSFGLTWASLHPTRTAMDWSWYSYERARELLEQARDRQAELKQVLQDLADANRQLARLNERLVATRHMAEEATRTKEQFVANVSHELRTPLNIITGFSEIILQAPRVYGGKLPPALLADIATIHRNSQHLSDLVSDILDLSQVEAGRMALTREWLSLSEAIGEAVMAARELFESKGLYLETDTPEDLPPLFCDRTRIRQVVLNLLSNAGRFTDTGGARLRVRREGGRIVVSVSDTGSGISPEDQGMLFEPFRQLDGSTRRRHGGSGLGLSISKRFVEMHGGEMWFESTIGVGTTLYFSLPVERPSLAGDSVSRWFSPHLRYEVRTRRSRAPVPKMAPRFVILEEEDALRRLMSRYADEVDIVSVQSYEEALDELKRLPAQALVVNDAAVSDTLNQLAQLGELPYGAAGLVCSVAGHRDAVDRLGVTNYLIKPVQRGELLAALEGLGPDIRTLLVVDDDPEALQLVTRMLASAPREYRVLRASNGERGLSLIRDRRPDAVLLDLVMPGMDGWHVLHEKYQDEALRDIPVIVISAKDPIGEPIMSRALTITHGAGLSVRHLLACIGAVSEVLSPSRSTGGRGRQGDPGD